MTDSAKTDPQQQQQQKQLELYDLLHWNDNNNDDDDDDDDGNSNEEENDSDDDEGENELLWNNVRQWLRRNKGTTNIDNSTTNNGATSCISCLDVMLKKNAPVDVVEVFLKEHGAAEVIKYKDKERGWLPLHYACNNRRVSVEVVRLLIQGYPKGLRIRDDQQGRLPIHMACSNGSSLDVLNLLVESCPDSCRIPDRRSHLLPIHLLRDYYIHRQQLAYDSSKSSPLSPIPIPPPTPPPPLGNNQNSSSSSNTAIPLVEIIEKVRRFEFGHYCDDESQRHPQQTSSLKTTTAQDANTTLGDDDTQTIMTNTTSYTMTTDAATATNNREEEEEEEEIACLETLVQDMFLDPFQQVGQSNIIQSYPTPLPTSLIEKMLLPLVGDREAASIHGNSSVLLMEGSSSATINNTVSSTSAPFGNDTYKISSTIHTIQENLLERMTALSSPAAAMHATKHHHPHGGKTSAATTTTSSTPPPPTTSLLPASFSSKEEVSFHSSSQRSSSRQQKQHPQSNLSSSSMYTIISSQPLPIHIAAEFGCSVALVKSLMETYPDSVRQIYMPHATTTTTTTATSSSLTTTASTTATPVQQFPSQNHPQQRHAATRKTLTIDTATSTADDATKRAHFKKPAHAGQEHSTENNRNTIAALRGPVLFPIDCLERGRAGLSYLYTAEKLKERKSKKSSNRLSGSNSITARNKIEETSSSLLKELERTFKDFTLLHDCIFAFYPDVPSSPRIRVSQKPQYVQTHDVEVLGDPPHVIDVTYNSGSGIAYSNLLLRQLSQHYTIAYRPPSKRSANSGSRSLISLISPAQPRNRDKQRITRLVQQIRSEAKNTKITELTSCTALMWMWICGYTCDMTPTSPSLGHTMFLTSIGRVLFGLDSSAIQKLSFVRSPLDKKGIHMKVLHTNRPVAVEAEKRAPNATMEDILDPSYNIFEIAGTAGGSVAKGISSGLSTRTDDMASAIARGAKLPRSAAQDVATVYSRTGSVRHVTTAGNGTYVVTAPFFWQRIVLSFLDARDALAFSSSCVRAYATGVRLLTPEFLQIPQNSLNKISSIDKPTFLQNVYFMFPEMTHSLFIDYSASLESFKSGDGNKSAVDLCGGLLLSLKSMDKSLSSRILSEPQMKGKGFQLKLQEENLFSEIGGDSDSSKVKTITLSYFLTNPNFNLEISKLQKRQLVYVCDAFGDTLLQKLLRMHASDETESNVLSYLQQLLSAGFGDGTSSSNLFHMYALHTQFQDLAQKGANNPPSELLKGGGLSVRSAPNEKTFSVRSRKSNAEDIGSIGKSSAASRSLAASATYIYKLPLHYYLKNNHAENIRPAIVEILARFCESWLLETDSDRRTPLHNALLVLLLSLKEIPARSIKHQQHAANVVKVLLSGPGYNALQIKDAGGNLPLHIATAVGAPYCIVELLVKHYADGCYRKTLAGDLPLHLHVMSGMATTSSVELLLRPCAKSESALRVFSSRGFVLPIHVAVQYQVSIDLLAQICRTYPPGARETRNNSLSLQGTLEVYALDILEEAREDVLAQQSDNLLEQFNAKSDLLFVYFPDAVSILPHRTKTAADFSDHRYRKEPERLRRLECLIRSEVMTMREDQEFVEGNCRLSETAYLAWIWLATFQSHDDDPDDNYMDSIQNILDGLHYDAVKFLASINVDEQLFSPPHRVLHLYNIEITELSIPALNARRTLTVQDCASPECAALLSNRLRFVGRYEFSSLRMNRFYEGTPVVHQSKISPNNASLILRAQDFGFIQEYRAVLRLLENSNIERNNSVLCNYNGPNKGSAFVDIPKVNGYVPLLLLKSFCRKLGLLEVPKELFSGGLSEDIPQTDMGDILTLVNREAFLNFCKRHYIDEFGIRSVVIIFMTGRVDFERELTLRKTTSFAESWNPVVPVLEQYDGSIASESSPTSTLETGVGGAVNLAESNMLQKVNEDQKDESPVSALGQEFKERIFPSSESGVNDRNKRFAADICKTHFHEIVGCSLLFYKYAIVLPSAERDLSSIMKHEKLSVIQIRQYLFQVGKCLQALHNHSVIHGNMKMSKVVRFQNTHLSLVNLSDSFSLCGHPSFVQGSLSNFIGGASRHWKTSLLPPEMVFKFGDSSDTSREQQIKKARLDRYWKVVSDDAKDFKLLTTDDAYNITCIITKISGQNHIQAPLVGTNRSGKNAYVTSWKEIVSSSLVTISFEDLPHSLGLCETFEEFQAAWDRMLFNADLWEKVKPVIHADNSIYVIKAFNDTVQKFPCRRGFEHDLKKNNEKEITDAQDLSLLPYDLILASEKTDIWMFGALIYYLCSGKSLFSSDDVGNLHDSSSALQQLESWDKKTAEKIITKNVEDPLAQNLLLLMLVPQDDRLHSMNSVLSHPFFGPTSSIEAQYILEKHEELNLMIEETVVIQRANMTINTLRRIDNATEKQCKIVFDEDKIVVPTCFMVLPYKLRWDSETKTLVVPESTESKGNLELAVTIGKHLLDINNATARLSFWLMMKKNIAGSDGGVFRSKLKLWLKRINSEPGEHVAMEIVRDIGCEVEYINVCREVLEQNDIVSNAKAYIKDPMGAAREAIKQSTEAIIKCYWPKTLYFYLIDEFTGLPVFSAGTFGGSETHDTLDVIYPLQVDSKKTRLLTQVFLPFMNISAMAVMSLLGGLPGLASVLGLPQTFGIPESWKAAEAGVIHRIHQPSSVAEFAVLQDMIRKQQDKRRTPLSPDDSSNPSASSDESLWHLSELRQLEMFYREFDPMRSFSDLRRVSDGKSSAMWTNVSTIREITEDFEVAALETQLRELRKEYASKDKILQEIESIHSQVKELKFKKSLLQKTDRKETPSKSVSSKRHTENGDTNANNKPGATTVSVSSLTSKEEKKKKTRGKKSKLNLRPYFGRS